MTNYADVATNLVENILKVNRGNVICLNGEIHKETDTRDPLVELPFIEELALAVSRRQAYPVINFHTRRLRMRNKEELDNNCQVHRQSLEKWINSIDMFIEVSWKNLAHEFESFPDKDFLDYNPLFWQLVFHQRKQLVFLNFPTHELALNIKMDFNELRNNYLKTLDCVYPKLKNQAQQLREDFFSFSNYRITNGDEDLTIKIKRDSYQLYQGIAPDHHLVILPPGVVEFPFEKSSLNGSFLADRLYYKDQVYENVKVSFSEGIVRFMTFHSEIKGNFQLQGKLINSQEECLFSLGFNEACQDFTNFYLYDRCLPGNICLKFFDSESYPVILASREAVIRKRKSLIEKLTKKDI